MTSFRHCERSEAIQGDWVERFSPILLDCSVASLLAMTAVGLTDIVGRESR